VILAHLTSVPVQAYSIASGEDLSRRTGPKAARQEREGHPPFCVMSSMRVAVGLPTLLRLSWQ
jgi:hypothetical protein